MPSDNSIITRVGQTLMTTAVIKLHEAGYQCLENGQRWNPPL